MSRKLSPSSADVGWWKMIHHRPVLMDLCSLLQLIVCVFINVCFNKNSKGVCVFQPKPKQKCSKITWFQIHCFQVCFVCVCVCSKILHLNWSHLIEYYGMITPWFNITILIEFLFFSLSILVQVSTRLAHDNDGHAKRR